MTKYSVSTGEKYGRLTVVEYSGTRNGNKSWLCRCDCGNYRVVTSYNLTRGKSASCGCIRREMFSKPSGEARFNTLYITYRTGARKRNLIFSLTKEQFREITKKKCYYCNIEPSQIYSGKGSNGGYVYNGIDRIDNSIGYILENCVPCCKDCNRAKSDRTEKDFLDWVERIYVNKHDEFRE